MERCQDIFRTKRYKLNVYSKDNYSFYHCLNMAILDNKQDVTPKKAMQKQNELFEFEMKNPIYYHMFLPQCVECDGDCPPRDCLSADLKTIQKGKSPQHQGKYLLQPKCYRDAFVLSVSTMLLAGTLKG